ncbi:MAG: CDP-glucose 4,6-dehydratase [Zoogloeaceae bacterium]|jgi:CDP-glucose 4,6-dehydratase|nr:CDP-glucose 4,6-dehydratase [Zoogloeaceae bacterium]
MNARFWQGKRVFLTGHTGFKGGWLALMLVRLGANITGFALSPPTDPSLFDLARVGRDMRSVIADIRDAEKILSAVREARPEIIFHLAAQPLVRQSYDDPMETYATNVMGLVHLFEAARQCDPARVIVVVTSDKCYENREWLWRYRENEALGGHDPYSSSKACAELVTAAYRDAFFRARNLHVATARAGNVIGGGDWGKDRLVPDVLRAIVSGMPLRLRNPKAVRPWQHVLEPLSGYLLLAEKLHEAGEAYASPWNFGPADEDARPVEWLVKRLARDWEGQFSWEIDPRAHPHEAHELRLDATQARLRLGWQPRWRLETALSRVVDWQRAWRAGQDMREFTLSQIAAFEAEPTE